MFLISYSHFERLRVVYAYCDPWPCPEPRSQIQAFNLHLHLRASSGSIYIYILELKSNARSKEQGARGLYPLNPSGMDHMRVVTYELLRHNAHARGSFIDSYKNILSCVFFLSQCRMYLTLFFCQ